MSLFNLSGNCPRKTPEEIQHSHHNHFVTWESDLTRKVEEFHLGGCRAGLGLLGDSEDTSFAAQSKTALELGARSF